MATKLLGALFLLLAFAGIAFGVGALFFYSDSYEPPTQARVAASEIGAPVVPAVQPYQSPASRRPDGLLLVDALHRNSFSEDEIVSLSSKVAALGHGVALLGEFGSVEEKDRLAEMEEQLREADSLLVIGPRTDYTPAEAGLVERFVRKGGKLLLISDAARPDGINTLANRFGVNYQPDVLYNQLENDGNYKHIFIRDFQPDELSAGVDAIALYAAGSINSSGSGLAFTDGNTKSSLLQSADSFSPIAWGDSRNVLAIADLTFIIPPNDVVLDNDRLLSNIAQYLTAGEREYDLADFPHFYGNDGANAGVDILLGQPTLLGSGTALKNGLADNGVSASVRDVEDVSRDTVFLGLHEDAYRVDRYLRTAGISVDDALSGPFGRDVGLEKTAVTILDSSQQRHVLIILADTPEVLGKAVERLLSGEFRDDLVSDFAGVSNIP